MDRFLKFIAYNFFSRKDAKNLKTPLHLSRQDASKHVSGGLKKSILKFDPRSGLWPWHIMFELCDPTENTSNRSLKTVFPLTEAYKTRIQQAYYANPKKCYNALPLIYSEKMVASFFNLRFFKALRNAQENKWHIWNPQEVLSKKHVFFV